MRDLQIRRMNTTKGPRWVATSVKANYRTHRLYGLGAVDETKFGALIGLFFHMVLIGMLPWYEGRPVPGTEGYSWTD